MLGNQLAVYGHDKAHKEAISQLGQCNILVIGKTGVGKSTLINAVFGKRLAEASAGKPVTQGSSSTKNRVVPLQFMTPVDLKSLVGT